MYDTHCHLAFDTFAGRVDQVVADAAAAGVHGMITVSTSALNVEHNRRLAEQFDRVWFSAGVHPLHADDPTDWPLLRAAAEHPRCVAFGEMGLDNHYDHPPRTLQRRILEEQIAFLESCRRDGVSKPIILHCREAFADLIAILSHSGIDPSRFVFHCFTGTPDEAKRVLDFGSWISFTGVVTYPNARETAEAAMLVPDDRLMVETDAPFLSPVPVRGRFPNEPKNVVHIAQFLAQLRGVDPEPFEEQLDANAQRFFGLPAKSTSQP